MGMVQEFKEFINRGNVLDLAVGVVIGAAFGKIIASLVKDVIMPPIGVLLGGVDFSDIAIRLTDGAKPAVIKIGVFVNVVIEFLIVAFAIFLVVKAFNAMKRKEEAKEEEKPEEPSEEVLLLRKIAENTNK